YYIPEGVVKNTVTELFSLIQNGNIMEIEDTVLPFERLHIKKTLIFQEDQALGVHEFVLGDPFPERLAPIYELMSRLSKELKQYPLFTFHIEIAATSKIVRQGQKINFNLAYVNLGTEEVEFLNPLLFKENEGNYLRLNAWLKGVGDESLQSSELIFSFNLANFEHRKDAFTVVPSDKKWLHLTSQERLTFSVTASIPKCPLGLYLFEIVYNSYLDEEPKGNMIEGEYHSDMLRIQIQQA
ncbi:MAG: hypothetical protein WBE11_12755, partial [Candidatus Aminicenantaceae bacterium]